jgi:Sec-independent protein secretion pathway component TatC
MPEEDRPAPVVGKEEARQGQPQGFVRTVMYVSIALALLGMFIAYLVIFP